MIFVLKVINCVITEPTCEQTLQTQVAALMENVQRLERDLASSNEKILQDEQIRASLELEIKRLASNTRVLHFSTASEYEREIHNLQQELIRTMNDKEELQRYADLSDEKVNLLEGVSGIDHCFEFGCTLLKSRSFLILQKLANAKNGDAALMSRIADFALRARNALTDAHAHIDDLQEQVPFPIRSSFSNPR
jgi:chromosome segregation ATPase